MGSEITEAVDLAALLPPPLSRGSHVAARALYGPHRAGWVSCIFKQWQTENPQGPDSQMLVPMDFGEQNLRTRSYWGVTLVLEGRITLKEAEGWRGERGPGTLLWFHGDHLSAETLPFQARPGLRECAFTMDANTARKLEDVALLRFEKRVRQVPLTSGLVLDYLDIFQTFCDAALPTETILRRVMTFLDRLEPPPPRDFGPDWVRRAADLLRQHVEPGFSMREAARVVGVPYPVFRREFRAVMGQAPIQYQLQARMRRARHWLRTRSVKETAALLGYDDPFLFSRQFKRVTGVAPSQFAVKE